MISRFQNIKLCMKKITNMESFVYKAQDGEFVFNTDTKQVQIWYGDRWYAVDTGLVEPPEFAVDQKVLEELL